MIKEKRNSMHLTQEQMSEKLGISLRQYVRIDNEKAFAISILYDARATLEANITNIKNRIDAEIVELFRRKEK